MDRMRKNSTLSVVCKKRLIEQICSTKFSLVSPEEEINHNSGAERQTLYCTVH